MDQWFAGQYFSGLCPANDEICLRGSIKISGKFAANSTIKFAEAGARSVAKKAGGGAALIVKNVKVYRSLSAR
jgi:hypothetical protein